LLASRASSRSAQRSVAADLLKQLRKYGVVGDPQNRHEHGFAD
jgi:hypothetical protein